MPKTAEHLRRFRFLPGHKNISPGRPKEKTLKEYARQYLASMTEEERAQYLNGLHPSEVWRMAEGNPSDNVDLEIKGNVSIKIVELQETIKKIADNHKKS